MVNAVIKPVNRLIKYTGSQVDEINSFVENGLPKFRFFSTPGAATNTLQKTNYTSNDIFDSLIPRTNSGKIKEAQRMRNDISVIQSIVNFKLNLYNKDFAVSTVGKNISKVSTLFDKWNIKDIQKKLHDDLLTSDNAILVWKTKSKSNKEIDFVFRLSPSEAQVIEVNGLKFLSVILDAPFYERLKGILDRPDDHDPLLVKEIKRIPQKWFDAARTGKPLSLQAADGYNWIIKSKNATVEDNGLCKPSMMAIYTDGLILRMLELAEFSTAFSLKNLILHVSLGETVKENDQVNTKYRANKPKINSLRRVLNNLEKSTRLYTDHTVKLNYIFPPIELFKKDRFESVHFRVINIWSGLPNALFAGDTKTSIGSAFVAMKRPQIEGQGNREIVIDILREFVERAAGIKKSNQPGIEYDNDALRDERLKLDIIKFMKQWGILDNTSVQKDFGYNPEIVQAGLEDDLANKDSRMPSFEPSQGIVAVKVHGIEKNSSSESGADGEPGAPKGDNAAPVGDEKVTGKIPRSDR